MKELVAVVLGAQQLAEHLIQQVMAELEFN
jgi:hypothetical protein